MFSFFRRRKSAEHALRDLSDGLMKALGDKLISLLLYGSKASGEFRDDGSDVNVFLVLEDASWETLQLLNKPFRQWAQAGHASPVFVPKNELQIYADSLPVEFLDMQDHHKVLFGPDLIQGLNVSRSHLRAQCAQELSVKEYKLRQAIVLAGTDANRLREILLGSLPSILTLYRGVLRLEGDVPKGNKMVAAKELAKHVVFDVDCLERLWDRHMRRQSDNVGDLARLYVDGVSRVLIYLSRK
jgi:hypothetical protein